LCAAFLSAFSPPAFSLDTAQDATAKVSASELSRLVEISTKLATLNETLRNELEGSKRNSGELARTLESSKAELDALKKELESLRTTSIELAHSAENSVTELTELRKALSKAESSLTNLEASFESYRSAAEAKIARLERKARFEKVGLIVLGSLALGGWSAFAFQAAF
jgi:septal ring factor EnvC (AmiA/AmiB activator)